MPNRNRCIYCFLGHHFLKRFHPFLYLLVWFHGWFNAHLGSSTLESPTCRHRTRPLYYRSIGGSRTSGWRWSKWCDHNLSHTRKLLLASWPVVGRKQTWKPDILSSTHQHPIQYKDIERIRKERVFFATTFLTDCWPLYLQDWKFPLLHSSTCHQWESITKLYLFVCLSKPEMLVDLLAINCNHTTINLAFAWEATLHYNARLVLLFPFCQKHLKEKETHGLECTTNVFSFVQGDINTHTHPCKCFGICFPGTRICVDNSWLCTLAGGSISNRGAL